MATILFMMFFIAALETTASGNDSVKQLEEQPSQEEPDLCVGCDDKKEEPQEIEVPQLTVEIVIDPLTGSVQYVIRGIEIK